MLPFVLLLVLLFTRQEIKGSLPYLAARYFKAPPELPVLWYFIDCAFVRNEKSSKSIFWRPVTIPDNHRDEQSRK